MDPLALLEHSYQEALFEWNRVYKIEAKGSADANIVNETTTGFREGKNKDLNKILSRMNKCKALIEFAKEIDNVY